jgi:hypothetical protein
MVRSHKRAVKVAYLSIALCLQPYASLVWKAAVRGRWGVLPYLGKPIAGFASIDDGDLSNPSVDGSGDPAIDSKASYQKHL